MQFKFFFLLIIVLLAPPTNAEEIGNLEPLSIKTTNNSVIKFNVEIADTVEMQTKGLMFRKYMPDNQGMLFLFRNPRIINMWMKNTYIPLDILFIDEKGVIKSIVKNATPESLKTLSSEVSVIAALELNAMMIEKNSIDVNDVVMHPFFNNIKDSNGN